MKKLFDKNHEYTLAELDCQYCLYHQTNRAPCPLKVCCCADEKRAALRKNANGKRGSTRELFARCSVTDGNWKVPRNNCEGGM